MEIIEKLKSMDKNKKFTIASRRFLLTYKTHLKKNIAEDFFKSRGRVKEFHICHENGDKNNPYLHSHVYVDYYKRIQSKNCRVFDINEIHPNIKKVISASHIENCYKYLMKEDKECAYLKDKCKSFNVDTIIECKTQREAIDKATSAGDAVQRAKLWEISQVYTVENSWDSTSEDFEYWPWQQQFINHIRVKPIRKHLTIWIWDQPGQGGKNTLVDKLCKEEGNKHAQLTSLGDSRDISLVMKGYIKAGWKGKVLHINLSRSDNSVWTDSSYVTLEQLSDGKMTSVKYEGCNLKWGRGHTIVYSNYPPDVSRLSLDRWVIKKIVGKGENSKLIDIDPRSLMKKDNNNPISPNNKTTRKLLSPKLNIIKKVKDIKINEFDFCEKGLNIINIKEIEENKDKKIDSCPIGFKSLNGFCDLPILGPLN